MIEEKDEERSKSKNVGIGQRGEAKGKRTRGDEGKTENPQELVKMKNTGVGGTMKICLRNGKNER